MSSKVVTSALLPLIIFKFPETKGLSLEEIGALFGDQIALDDTQLTEQEKNELDSRLARHISLAGSGKDGNFKEGEVTPKSQVEDIEQHAAVKV